MGEFLASSRRNVRDLFYLISLAAVVGVAGCSSYYSRNSSYINIIINSNSSRNIMVKRQVL